MPTSATTQLATPTPTAAKKQTTMMDFFGSATTATKREMPKKAEEKKEDEQAKQRNANSESSTRAGTHSSPVVSSSAHRLLLAGRAQIKNQAFGAPSTKRKTSESGDTATIAAQAPPIERWKSVKFPPVPDPMRLTTATTTTGTKNGTSSSSSSSPSSTLPLERLLRYLGVALPPQLSSNAALLTFVKEQQHSSRRSTGAAQQPAVVCAEAFAADPPPVQVILRALGFLGVTPLLRVLILHNCVAEGGASQQHLADGAADGVGPAGGPCGVALALLHALHLDVGHRMAISLECDMRRLLFAPLCNPQTLITTLVPFQRWINAAAQRQVELIKYGRVYLRAVVVNDLRSVMFSPTRRFKKGFVKNDSNRNDSTGSYAFEEATAQQQQHQESSSPTSPQQQQQNCFQYDCALLIVPSLISIGNYGLYCRGAIEMEDSYGRGDIPGNARGTKLLFYAGYKEERNNLGSGYRMERRKRGTNAPKVSPIDGGGNHTATNKKEFVDSLVMRCLASMANDASGSSYTNNCHFSANATGEQFVVNHRPIANEEVFIEYGDKFNLKAEKVAAACTRSIAPDFLGMVCNVNLARLKMRAAAAMGVGAVGAPTKRDRANAKTNGKNGLADAEEAEEAERTGGEEVGST